jgi:hypothetical protein
MWEEKSFMDQKKTNFPKTKPIKNLISVQLTTPFVRFKDGF